MIRYLTLSILLSTVFIGSSNCMVPNQNDENFDAQQFKEAVADNPELQEEFNNLPNKKSFIDFFISCTTFLKKYRPLINLSFYSTVAITTILRIYLKLVSEGHLQFQSVCNNQTCRSNPNIEKFCTYSELINLIYYITGGVLVSCCGVLICYPEQKED